MKTNNPRTIFFQHGIFLLLTLSPAMVQANNIQIENIVAMGTGCPPESTDSVTSPSGESASLLFHDFSVKVPNEAPERRSSPNPTSGRLVDQKSCNIKITGKIEEGHQLESIEVKVDFRGLNYQEEQTMTRFESLLINWSGPRRSGNRNAQLMIKTESIGEHDEDFFYETQKSLSLTSTCAARHDQQFQFALRNTLLAQILSSSRGHEPVAMLNIDSADLQSHMSIIVRTRPCGDGRPNSRPLPPPTRNPWPRPIVQHPSGPRSAESAQEFCRQQRGQWEPRSQTCRVRRPSRN